MRKPVVLGALAVALAGAAVAAVPASAADTTVTFTAGAVGNTVSILPSAAMVGVTTGNSVSGTMTSVVTDTRVAGLTWTDAISSTDFVLAGATSQTGANHVPAASALITNATPTVSIPGTATVSNTHAAGSPLTLSNSPQTLLSATTANYNVVTFVSTVLIDVTGKSLGLYTGTITQTVS